MANDLSNIKSRGGLIAQDAAGFLRDHVQFVKSVDKEDSSLFDGVNGYRSGDTVKINTPAQFEVGTTADVTSSIQDVDEGSVNLTVDNQYNVPIAFTSAELATDQQYGRWRESVLKPAMITLANNIEKACLAQAVDATYNMAGTAGSTTFNTDTILQAGEKLDVNACFDYDNRLVLLNPAANRSAVNARKGLFQSSEEISSQYKSGAMGMADGFTFLRNNLLPSHTLGSDVTGVNVDGASQTGATLNVQGLTATTGTVTKGSVFTIAGVYKVHPVTKDTLSELQQFVVTADATADGSGDAALSISPSIITTGSTQTVSAAPADTAVMTFVGAANTSYGQNLAFHKSAFRFVSLPLIKPNGVDMVGQETMDDITVRIVQDYDVLKDRMVMRADVLWGLANVRPEWACRITA